jgi:ATP adenylyltransferase
MEYIRQARGGGAGRCIFCVAEADLEDPGRLLVGLYPNTVALLNRYPYNNGHVLVAPRRHAANLWDLAAEELRELFSLVSLGSRALAAGAGTADRAGRQHEDDAELQVGGGPQGQEDWGLGAGIVDHLHIHLVPRWVGDTNFMASVQETRVLPESLLETRRRLSAAFGPLRP